MTVTSKQIFKAIQHYQETNHVQEQQANMLTERLIEAMRTGQGNDYVIIEENIKGLGIGYFVKGHGSYYPNPLNSVTFVKGL